MRFETAVSGERMKKCVKHWSKNFVEHSWPHGRIWKTPFNGYTKTANSPIDDLTITKLIGQTRFTRICYHNVHKLKSHTLCVRLSSYMNCVYESYIYWPSTIWNHALLWTGQYGSKLHIDFYWQTEESW